MLFFLHDHPPHLSTSRHSRGCRRLGRQRSRSRRPAPAPSSLARSPPRRLLPFRPPTPRPPAPSPSLPTAPPWPGRSATTTAPPSATAVSSPKEDKVISPAGAAAPCVTFPVWSPDSKTLAFTSTCTGETATDNKPVQLPPDLPLLLSPHTAETNSSPTSPASSTSSPGLPTASPSPSSSSKTPPATPALSRP